MAGRGGPNGTAVTERLEQRAAAGGNGAALTVDSLLRKDEVRRRFEDILGQRAGAFMSSIITVTKGSVALQQCDAKTVIGAAAIAATLDLPVNPSLGFAWIVPYRNNGVWEAQFQIGYKGYTQLALRSGQYRTIHVGSVYEGEIRPLTARERLTGELAFVENPDVPENAKTEGYAAYFRLLNGAEMWDHMTVAEVTAHAKRFSKAFNKPASPWHSDFDAMACKTVLKRLLSHYGMLSVQMQAALVADQAVVRDADTGEVDYVDAGSAIDVEGGTVEPSAAQQEPAETQQRSLNDLLGDAPEGR